MDNPGIPVSTIYAADITGSNIYTREFKDQVARIMRRLDTIDPNSLIGVYLYSPNTEHEFQEFILKNIKNQEVLAFPDPFDDREILYLYQGKHKCIRSFLSSWEEVELCMVWMPVYLYLYILHDYLKQKLL